MPNGQPIPWPYNPYQWYPYPPGATPPFIPGQWPGQQTERPIPAQAGGQKPVQGNIFQKLYGHLKDPRTATVLMSAANQLTRPRRVGETGVGQYVSALTSGYNTLAMGRLMQQERERQMREEMRKAAESAAGVRATHAQAGKLEAETAEIPKMGKLAERRQTLAEQAAANEALIAKDGIAVAREKLAEDKRQADQTLQLEKDRLAEATKQGAAENVLRTRQVAVQEAEARSRGVTAQAAMLDVQDRVARRAKGEEIEERSLLLEALKVYSLANPQVLGEEDPTYIDKAFQFAADLVAGKAPSGTGGGRIITREELRAKTKAMQKRGLKITEKDVEEILKSRGFQVQPEQQGSALKSVGKITEHLWTPMMPAGR